MLKREISVNELGQAVDLMQEADVRFFISF